MRVSGKLQTLRAQGYERLLEIIPEGQATSIWISALEPEHLVDASPIVGRFKQGEFLAMNVGLKYVGELRFPDADSVLGMRQPIEGSPHTLVVAKVARCIDAFSFLCALGEQQPLIAAETEKPVSVRVGQLIAFTAELAHVD